MPVASIGALILDCADPGPMSVFYQEALGAVVVRADHDGDYLKVDGMLLLIRRLVDYRPPSWPSADVPTQLHLDLYVDDLAAGAAALQAVGATLPDHQPHAGDGLLVLLDPAGHPFCIATLEGVPPDLLPG